MDYGNNHHSGLWASLFVESLRNILKSLDKAKQTKQLKSKNIREDKKKGLSPRLP